MGALGEYLGGILADLPAAGPAEDSALPRAASRRPGQWLAVGVAHDETDDRIVIVAEEFLEEETARTSTATKPHSAAATPAAGRFRLTAPRRRLHAAAPAPVPHCGLPIDPAATARAERARPHETRRRTVAD